MGQCHMDTGRYREAGKYLKAAIKSFEWLRINWKRSTAYGCLFKPTISATGISTGIVTRACNADPPGDTDCHSCDENRLCPSKR